MAKKRTPKKKVSKKAPSNTVANITQATIVDCRHLSTREIERMADGRLATVEILNDSIRELRSELAKKTAERTTLLAQVDGLNQLMFERNRR